MAQSASASKDPPELPPVLEKAIGSAYGLGMWANESLQKAVIRKEKDHLYTTIEDFRRANPALKRLVVVGCTGAGKSTLLNIMAGWRFVQRPPEYEFEWENKDGETAPLFKAEAGNNSVTKVCSFANIEWRGDDSKPIVVVDTPGHDDTAASEIDSAEARTALKELAADLHNKLKSLGTINAILILHNDIHSNRLNPATYTILKMVDEKFAKVGGSVWEHVIIGYSKCNQHETSWRSGLDKKKAALKASIREKIPACAIDVPVIALGGGSIEPPPPNDGEDALEELYQFIAAAPDLDTSSLMPFEGVEVKFQKLVEEKDKAEAKAKAAVIYVAVIIKIAILVSIFFWRTFLLPAPIAMMLLDFSGIFDEMCIAALFVYWVGPSDCWYSLKHFNSIWIKPTLEKQVLPKLEPYLPKKKGD